MNNLQARWSRLQERERNFLKYGGLTIAILLCYVVIWSPFLDTVQQAQEELREKRHLLQWLQNTASQFQQLKQQSHRSSALAPDNLLSAVSQSLKDSALSNLVSEIKQTNDLKVTVTFKQVNFDDLIQWLLSIRKRYGLQVEQITVEQASTVPGVVQASLVLKT